MNKVLLTLLASIPTLLFAQEEFVVKGKIGNLNAPAKVFIQYEKDNQEFTDSSAIKNGEFSFKGTVSGPAEGYIILSPEGKSLDELYGDVDLVPIYLSKGTIRVEGENLQLANVFGTKLVEDLTAYRSAKKPLEDQLKAINEEFMNATEAQQSNEEFINSLRSKLAPLYEKLESVDAHYISSNKNYIALSLMEENISSENVLEYEQFFKEYPNELKNLDKGKSLAAKIESLSKVVVGALAQEIKLPNTEGKEVALSSLRGQYVLIDFWASWCVPCREENPNLVAAYNKYKDKGFTIYGISLDNPGKKEAWIKAIQDDHLYQWTNVSDLKGWKSVAAKEYAVQSIPRNFLLDKEGKIIATNLRGEELEAKLAELFD